MLRCLQTWRIISAFASIHSSDDPLPRFCSTSHNGQSGRVNKCGPKAMIACSEIIKLVAINGSNGACDGFAVSSCSVIWLARYLFGETSPHKPRWRIAFLSSCQWFWHIFMVYLQYSNKLIAGCSISPKPTVFFLRRDRSEKSSHRLISDGTSLRKQLNLLEYKLMIEDTPVNFIPR